MRTIRVEVTVCKQAVDANYRGTAELDVGATPTIDAMNALA